MNPITRTVVFTYLRMFVGALIGLAFNFWVFKDPWPTPLGWLQIWGMWFFVATVWVVVKMAVFVE